MSAHDLVLLCDARRRQVGLLHHPDAVLGGDAAAVALQRFGQQLRDLLALADEFRAAHALEPQHVDVLVAVADVAEPDHVELRILTPQHALRLGEVGRHRRHPPRHAVLLRIVPRTALGYLPPHPPPLHCPALALGLASIAPPPTPAAL